MVKLELLHYKATPNDCCDGYYVGPCSECDPFLQVCISNRCHETSQENDKYSIDLTNSSITPHVFTEIFNVWNEDTEIKITAFDKDIPDGSNYIDEVYLYYREPHSPKSNNISLVSNNFIITARITVDCSANFYGPQCTHYCQNTDHGKCDSSGNLTCQAGYFGQYCSLTSTTPATTSTSKLIISKSTPTTESSRIASNSERTIVPSTPTTQPKIVISTSISIRKLTNVTYPNIGSNELTMPSSTIIQTHKASTAIWNTKPTLMSNTSSLILKADVTRVTSTTSLTNVPLMNMYKTTSAAHLTTMLLTVTGQTRPTYKHTSNRTVLKSITYTSTVTITSKPGQITKTPKRASATSALDSRAQSTIMPIKPVSFKVLKTTESTAATSTTNASEIATLESVKTLRNETSSVISATPSNSGLATKPFTTGTSTPKYKTLSSTPTAKSSHAVASLLIKGDVRVRLDQVKEVIARLISSNLSDTDLEALSISASAKIVFGTDGQEVTQITYTVSYASNNLTDEEILRMVNDSMNNSQTLSSALATLDMQQYQGEITETQSDKNWIEEHVGIVAGVGSAFLLILAFSVVCFVRRKRSDQKEYFHDNGDDSFASGNQELKCIRSDFNGHIATGALKPTYSTNF